jgi:tripartite-type tricarboxylate transporter receptor subunit TctC
MAGQDHFERPRLNRPGAGTNIAAEADANASPDGYTLLSAGAPNAIDTTLYEKLNFNFAGIVSVKMIARGPTGRRR